MLAVWTSWSLLLGIVSIGSILNTLVPFWYLFYDFGPYYEIFVSQTILVLLRAKFSSSVTALIYVEPVAHILIILWGFSCGSVVCPLYV